MRWLLVMVAACGGDSDKKTDAFVDDTCVHTAGTPKTVGSIENIGTTELSGLAASHTIENLLWTHDDSGGDPLVYSVSATNAAVLGTLKLKGATNVDWEDIATGPCGASHCIYVSDTGDNDLTRTSVAIYQVVEPATQPIGVVTTDAVKFDITYPDGPHNVESLFVDPRDEKSYAIVKNEGKHADVFEMPRVVGGATAVKVGTLTIPADDPRVTAADMSVDSCSARILVRTYGPLYELRGTATTSVVELLGSALATMPVASESQGEAVAYSADGHAYFTTSEGANPPLSRVDD